MTENIDKKDQAFKPVVLSVNHSIVEAIVSKAQSFVANLKKLDELYLSLFSAKIEDHSALLNLSAAEFSHELKLQHIKAKNIKIQGLDVKIDKLIELIEMPDFSEIESVQAAAAAELKYLRSCNYLMLKLESFKKEKSWALPANFRDDVLAANTEQTETEAENRAIKAAETFLECLQEFEALGFPFQQSAGIDNNLVRLGRAVLAKNEKGKTVVNSRLLKILNLR